MELFIKASAGILIAVILCVALSRQGKDFSILLSLTVCCMVLLLSSTYLQEILSLVDHVTSMGNIDQELIRVLLKIAGIGLLSQVATLVCIDAGNQTLAKALQLMATALVLYLSIPLMEEMLLLIESVMGGV